MEGVLKATGADATVSSEKSWPSSWPLTTSMTHLKGVGQTTNIHQSSKVLTWTNEKGNTSTVQPYVVPSLPVNLWGRDVLAQLHLRMSSSNETVAHQVLTQGFCTGQGLGKHSQGIR